MLPPLLKDPAIRWSLAGALGAVLGSLAVLWGQGFATTQAPATGTSGRSVVATAERAVAIGGDNQSPVSTGDTTTPAQPLPAQPAAGPHPASLPAPDTVSASGNRGIAIGGTNSGPLSTGDQAGGDHS
ncbi:hypothetical protein GCM10010276_85900 [Streptomyces longisporus]|uniref:Secreted protein n=1 Tax=Streptomyces longisporus TaxID=1948 RepID=A0ABP6ARX2_STRLO